MEYSVYNPGAVSGRVGVAGSHQQGQLALHRPNRRRVLATPQNGLTVETCQLKAGLRIRIQHFRKNTNPDPDPIRIQGFNDQKLKKLQLKKN
jgi:hypothetical protein